MFVMKSTQESIKSTILEQFSDLKEIIQKGNLTKTQTSYKQHCKYRKLLEVVTSNPSVRSADELY